jgi:hypothetical protein
LEVAGDKEEVKGAESDQNFDDILENGTPEEEKEAKFYHSNQDYLIPEQLYQYGNRLSKSVEI